MPHQAAPATSPSFTPAPLKSFSPLADALSPLVARYGTPETGARTRQAHVAMLAWLLRGMHGRYLPAHMKAAFHVSTDRKASRRARAAQASTDAPKHVDYRAFVTDVSSARETLMRDHRAASLKLFSLRLMINSISSPRQVRKEMSLAGFSCHEANAYCDLLRDAALWPGMRTTLTSLGDADVRADLVLDPSLLRRQAGEDIERHGLLRTAAQAVRRKLRFVTQTGVVGPEDLQGDLIERGVLWYTHVRPLVCRAHAVNYARTAVTSGVQDLITHWTSEERARLVETTSGWESRVISVPGLLERLPDMSATGKDDDSYGAEYAAQLAMKEYDFGGEIVWRKKKAAKAGAQSSLSH